MNGRVAPVDTQPLSFRNERQNSRSLLNQREVEPKPIIFPKSEGERKTIATSRRMEELKKNNYNLPREYYESRVRICALLHLKEICQLLLAGILINWITATFFDQVIIIIILLISVFFIIVGLIKSIGL